MIKNANRCRKHLISLCFSLFFLILTWGHFFIHIQIEQEREREEEREKHRCERDTSTSCHPHYPNRGQGRTATEVRALSGNRTWDSLVRRPTLLTAEPNQPGLFVLLLILQKLLFSFLENIFNSTYLLTIGIKMFASFLLCVFTFIILLDLYK
uniref:Uncharacterized protein n=1 Tax=Molossus molossus TaxID=27622 RepID=A0A7J8EFL1_MOLMO|nr:hypothetical protein HJG59_008932 [Molossus molossus]